VSSPFRLSAFRHYLLARTAAVLGVQMTSVAVGLQVYDLTGKALDLGLIGLVQFIPVALLFPISGVVADRFDRRRVLMACMSISTLGMLCLYGLRHSVSLAPIYGALVILAVSRSLMAPANQSLLPLIAPGEAYTEAVTWASATFQLNTILGPALGGLIYGFWGGAGPVYALSAALCALAMAFYARLHLGALPPRRAPGWSEALDGLRFVRQRPVLIGAITVDLLAVLLGGATALLPIYAAEILQVGARGAGLLRAAPAIGAVAMALLLTRFPIRRRAGRLLFAAVAVYGMATLVFGLSTSFALSMGALAVAGAADEVSVIIRHAVVQLGTPDEMRGRVSAINFLFISVSNELGEMESGALAALLGPVGAVVVGGVGAMVVAGGGALWARELREVDGLSPGSASG
jgi:MFS family permease